MKFKTEKTYKIEYEGPGGSACARIPNGIELSVDKSKGAVPVDLGGRTVSKDIYDKYFAQEPPKKAAPAEQKEEE